MPWFLRLLRARRYQDLLTGDPTINSRADLTRKLGVSRARVTQILAPEIQEAIRFFSERRLRPLLRLADPQEQSLAFRRMLRQTDRVAPLSRRT